MEIKTPYAGILTSNILSIKWIQWKLKTFYINSINECSPQLGNWKSRGLIHEFPGIYLSIPRINGAIPSSFVETVLKIDRLKKFCILNFPRHRFVADPYYRSRFETGTGNGGDTPTSRGGWENSLFGISLVGHSRSQKCYLS